MKIKCINSGNNKLITKENEYEIISETENRYSILNDKGIQKNYAKNLFEEYVEPVPEVLVIDEVNIETKAELDEDVVLFDVTVKIENKEDFTYSSAIFNHSESSVSCGIKELSGLNDFMLFAENFNIAFKEYIDNQDYNLNEDFDYKELSNDLMECLIQDLIELYQGKCLYLLLSTNTENNNNYSMTVGNLLDEVSEVELFGINPNSGNNIKVWVLKCN